MTTQPDLPLVPRPSRVSMLGGVRAPNPAPLVEISPARDIETAGAYRLKIPADGPIQIEAADHAGERHARATLSQLGALPVPIPAMHIEDEPAFATRGFMLDISRNRVPTMGTLFRLVDLLASLKFNHLQLYTEHTFAYAGHESAWRDASPMTPAEVIELDGYCADRGIDLVPNQNCFGHLASWLRREAYAPLAETHGDWMFLDMPRHGPFSLCPTDPRSLAFVEDLLGQLLPCFRSGLVNIGCDETYDIGAGRSGAAVASRGKARVYADFVAQVCGVASRHQRRPMFWADIAMSDPSALEHLPDNAIGLSWWYEPDTPFAAACETLRARGMEAWVCPGTSSWRSITGRATERRENILKAAHEGAAGGATGLLLTDWGDSGHHQQWPITLGALALGAEAGWNGSSARTPHPGASAVHVLGDRSGGLQLWLDALGDADLHLRQAGTIHNSSALFNDLYQPTGAKSVEASADDFELAETTLLELGPPPGVSSDSLLGRELLQTVELALVAARWGQRRDRKVTAAERARFGGALERLRDRHATLWHERSRPGGLPESVAVFDEIIGRIAGGDDR